MRDYLKHSQFASRERGKGGNYYYRYHRSTSYYPTVFEELAERYDSWFDGKGRDLYREELRVVEKSLKGCPKPWLEIGCGSCRFSSPLGVEFGLDPSAELLSICRERDPSIQLIRGVGENLPFLDNTFGTSILLFTICFVRDPVRVIKEAHRVISHGGRIIIGFIDRESPWGRYYTKKRDTSPFYSKAKFFTLVEIENLLREVNLTVERTLSGISTLPTSFEGGIDMDEKKNSFIVAVSSRKKLFM